jgi:hypothetical protein
MVDPRKRRLGAAFSKIKNDISKFPIILKKILILDTVSDNITGVYKVSVKY